MLPILAAVVRGVSDLSISRVWLPPNRYRPMRLRFHIDQPLLLVPRNVHALRDEQLLAGRMQASAPELMDLSNESEATKKAYGLDRKTPDIRNRGGGKGTYETFARNCLLARRMVERGVRFVTCLHASWDHHSGINKELPFCAGMCDQPLAALIKDLKQRGMLDETMVIWASEFGRTPLGENRTSRSGVTGRDHHPYAFTTWAAGGGIKGGQIIGKTDDIGWNVIDERVSAHDLHATILNRFGFNHEELTYRFQGLDFRLTGFEGANVVKKLLA